MAWHRIGDKTLSEPMLTSFADAYMWHWGRWVNSLCPSHTIWHHRYWHGCAKRLTKSMLTASLRPSGLHVKFCWLKKILSRNTGFGWFFFFRPQQINFPSTGCQESIEWDFYKYQFVLEIMNLNHNLTLRIFSNLLFLPVSYHIASMKIHMARRFVKKYSPQRLDSEWKYPMNVGTHIIHDDIIKWEHFLRYWPFV